MPAWSTLQVALADAGEAGHSPILHLQSVCSSKQPPKATLGQCFRMGHCTPAAITFLQSPDIALRWFRAAAELGHGHAQMMLGRYLSGGLTGEPDRAEARLWLERAVAQGVPEAENDLAQLGREM